MNYATPTAELIDFNMADVMVPSEEREPGELPGAPLPGIKTDGLTIRDVEDI